MNDDKEFCPNCGKSVSKNDDFCQNCGYDLRPYHKSQAKQTEQNASQQTPKTQPVSTQAATPNNNGKKKKSPLVPIILVIIILAAAYFAGSWFYGKGRQTQTLADNMTSGVTSKMASAAVDENGQSISEADLKPLSNLYVKNSSASNQVKESILKDSKSTNFKVTQTGKYLGLFPKYKVAVTTRSIDIETNIDNPSFKIDGSSVSAKNNGSEYTLEKKLPGLYKVSVSGKKSKQVTVPIAGEADEYVINELVESDDDSISDDSTTSSTTKKQPSSPTHPTYSASDDDDYYEPSDDSATFLGSWTNDTSTVSFYDDGTYSLDEKTGSYKVNSWHGDQVSITYYEDGKSGPGWTASYTLEGDSLELNSNHMTWYR
ncbi:zinc-ribbon domain-containing protein [Companilactobacillus keshanensis]|uniref:Zinc-ribbon domain-containing protein n=1 Tax=Companilactobacillus keshanensis TaxID=2486003 RepID=A0ABW4BSH6_9LACO|nr:zinc ribbon domain-containing protein [Companilactobacillus keshanensis]